MENMTSVQWKAAELAFHAQQQWNKPFYEVEMDAVFTSPTGKTMIVPAFWDGGSVWKIRFALNETGLWQVETRCTADSGLNGQTGTVECLPYTGNLEIYRRGFVKTQPGVRYMMYADGTPFFYLGDTHWNMPEEELDEPGPHAGNTGAESHFGYIVKRRVEQGFTVYQSEPIGAKYNLSDGFGEEDLPGFRDLDRRFACIAEAGLVHANAQLVFTPGLIANNVYLDDAYMRLLARYWAARYSAYPVLWTTAQESDKNFYHERGDQKAWNAETNPWKKIAAWVAEFDPHHHPLTAHMEFASFTSASGSAFRDIPGHSWYGVQYSFRLDGLPDFSLLRDFWENGQGKAVINYEGWYDHLWTKELGCRAYGWMGFLSGMYGYGYGAQDIWLYLCQYDMDRATSDGVDTVTPEDKKVPWSESVEFPSAFQVNYMREFLQTLEWWKLTPGLDDKDYADLTGRALYAHTGSDVYVVYLYGSEAGGTLRLLDADAAYTARWFNPRTGEYTDIGTISSADSWSIPSRPDSGDWVLLVTKN